jgi:hypothetical protein
VGDKERRKEKREPNNTHTQTPTTDNRRHKTT